MVQEQSPRCNSVFECKKYVDSRNSSPVFWKFMSKIMSLQSVAKLCTAFRDGYASTRACERSGKSTAARSPDTSSLVGYGVLRSRRGQRGGLLVDTMQQGTSVNAPSYYAALKRLRMDIKRKRHRLLRKAVLLQYVSAWPHFAMATQPFLQFPVPDNGTVCI
jgi:hypothetical protein